jgi:hypothetical protein
MGVLRGKEPEAQNLPLPFGGHPQGHVYGRPLHPKSLPEHLQEKAIQVNKGHLLRQRPLLESLGRFQHLVGDGADGFVGVPVAQQEAHHLRRFALTHPSGVKGNGHLPHVHLTAGIGLKEAGIVFPFPIPGDGQLHLAKGGLQLAGVVAVLASPVLAQEGFPVGVQENLQDLGHRLPHRFP